MIASSLELCPGGHSTFLALSQITILLAKLQVYESSAGRDLGHSLYLSFFISKQVRVLPDPDSSLSCIRLSQYPVRHLASPKMLLYIRCNPVTLDMTLGLQCPWLCPQGVSCSALLSTNWKSFLVSLTHTHTERMSHNYGSRHRVMDFSQSVIKAWLSGTVQLQKGVVLCVCTCVRTLRMHISVYLLLLCIWDHQGSALTCMSWECFFFVFRFLSLVFPLLGNRFIITLSVL